MRAVLCDRLGDPSVLKLVDLPVPEPGPGEALVRVRAAALNFPDVLMVAGGYQHKPVLPFVPGIEGAGEIAKVGPGVVRWKLGDKVIFGRRTGCFAEYAAARDDGMMALPEGWDFAEGAAYQVAAKTAYHGLVQRAAVKPRETVLVHGATGGVGLAAVQLAAHLGARAIATGGDDAKLEVARARGAGFAINYRDADFVPIVKDLTDGRGVDVVFDTVGGDTFERSLRCAAFGARLLIVGFTSGGPSRVQTNHTLIKGLTIMGIRAGEVTKHQPGIAVDYARELPRLAAVGAMRPHISHRYPLERAADLMREMSARKVVGKAVVEIV